MLDTSVTDPPLVLQPVEAITTPVAPVNTLDQHYYAAACNIKPCISILGNSR